MMNKPDHSMTLQPGAIGKPPIAVNDFLLTSWPLPSPPAEGDKEMKGRILLVGGSPEMPGAILLAATAALHAGAGKLTVATAASVAPLVAARMPEARVIALAEDANQRLKSGALQEGLAEQAGRYDAVVIGPGMQATQSLLDDIAALLPKFTEASVLLDACAMDVVRMPAWRDRPADTRPAVLLTPHAGEMAHLTGRAKEDIQADPDTILQQTSRDWDAVVALKGARTLIGTPDGDAWDHRGGNSGLGVSGSGDTLAGIIGGLIARGASLPQAAVWGVALHARAGETLAHKSGPIGYLARDLSAEVPRLMHRFAGG